MSSGITRSLNYAYFLTTARKISR